MNWKEKTDRQFAGGEENYGANCYLHNDAIGRADGDVVRMFQLAGPVAHGAELADKGAVRLEDLHSVVLLVSLRPINSLDQSIRINQRRLLFI